MMLTSPRAMIAFQLLLQMRGEAADADAPDAVSRACELAERFVTECCRRWGHEHPVRSTHGWECSRCSAELAEPPPCPDLCASSFEYPGSPTPGRPLRSVPR